MTETVKPIHSAVSEWRSNQELLAAFKKQAEDHSNLTDVDNELLGWFVSGFAKVVNGLAMTIEDIQELKKAAIIHVDGLNNIEVRKDENDPSIRHMTFTVDRFQLEVELAKYDPIATTTGTKYIYNSPDNEHYLADAKRLHDLCRRAQLSYSLSFEDGQNLWNGSITSAAPAEEMMTRDYSLSTVMELLIDHVEVLVRPSSNVPDSSQFVESPPVWQGSQTK